MAVPKKRKSKSKTRSRRASSWSLSASASSRCENCGEVKLPHRVCGSCGTYKGMQVTSKEA